uniref:AlNc14C9G1181 protein n=1 Tax=Albugo laibachii Nc14 TaxID=890382 RepID=F0W2D1_9STRA|nr:AlNc14C9G1181 [Albugo laibachii Nc14]|eukprot:CCA15216.1 AlNc14C9G1181 [Albugo laibachii Nc14]
METKEILHRDDSSTNKLAQLSMDSTNVPCQIVAYSRIKFAACSITATSTCNFQNMEV